MRLAASLLIALLPFAATAADIFTWKDKDGQVHYSDNPPPAPTVSRTLDKSAPPSTAPSQATRSIAEQELEFRKRRAAASEAQAKADQEKAATEEKRRNCEVARGQLAALETGQRIVRTRADGEREYLDDAQRAAEVQRVRKAMGDWCK